MFGFRSIVREHGGEINVESEEGQGTRIRDITGNQMPKPMVPIGGRPILWHIMSLYAARGCQEFVVACGYRGEMIKYAANAFLATKISFANEIAQAWRDDVRADRQIEGDDRLPDLLLTNQVPALLAEIAACAARVAALGWAEAGAGNLSLLEQASCHLRSPHLPLDDQTLSRMKREKLHAKDRLIRMYESRQH